MPTVTDGPKTREAYFPVDYKTREENGEKIIEGYFIVHDSPTELWPGFYEKVAAGACTKSIQQNDIRALYNHNRDIVLGRKQPKTLTLAEDAYGVKGTIIVNQSDTEALNVYERVKRGDITGCSFGFWPEKEEYDYKDNGEIYATVLEADILEISVCPFPAYPQTAIEARRMDFEEQRKRSLEAKKTLVRERLKNVTGSIKD